MKSRWDVVIVGAGPNGLTAAAALAGAGRSVLVLEAASTLGGGARSEALTEPGFVHDRCSAIHPMGAASEAFRALELESRWGLSWVHPEVCLAHPFDDGSAALVLRGVDATVEAFGEEGRAYRDLLAPLVEHGDALLAATMRPIRLPAARDVPLLARFGALALRSASSLSRSTLGDGRARALFGGVAAHAATPLERAGTSAFGLMLLVAGHRAGWPAARGGSGAISDALVRCARSLGVQLEVDRRVGSMRDLPDARTVVFDLGPRQILDVAGDELPASFRSALARYRYGPGVFKLDWSLDGPIPWTSESARRAGTVHVGGSFEEIAESERRVAAGEVSERPFVLVAQQSIFDATRAPAGFHTGWAYCHVPAGCELEVTARIEAQIERFAPGFRDRIRVRRASFPRDVERHDENMIGGDVGGGANDLRQVLARPVARWDPYSTPNPRIFSCSSSTPPGGGVHGACGWNAAQSVLRRT